ncbi:MAG: hypothetical protein VB089_08960 [Anaerolineaceae bacterium]|nr:hypothetical protein [Anaerolineaceae bacterium]
MDRIAFSPSMHVSRWAMALAAGLLLAGCGAPAPVASATQAVITAQAVAPEATLTATEENPLAACPQATGDSLAYTNREDGYCFLYPADFTAGPDVTQAGRGVAVRGKLADPGPKQQEGLVVALSLARNGPPDGLDSQAYARQWLDVFAPGLQPEQQAIRLGDTRGVVMGGLPGYGSQRGAFVVTPYGRYTAILSPEPGEVEGASNPGQRLWDTVMASLVFFAPQAEMVVVRPEDVCPVEAEGVKVYTSQADGICFGYPADFAVDETLPGRVAGGPVLGEETGFGEVQTSLTVGSFGYFPGQTPRQVLEPRLEFIDPATVQETTLGGYPAVTFVDPRGPWASRQAIIGVDGMVYTLIAQPFATERFAAGAADLERVWEQVTASLAFFTPWR